MLKAVARFILRRELRNLHAASVFQQVQIAQWKTAAKAWERYAKAFVPPTAPPFHGWFMENVPKTPPKETLS